MRKTLVILSLIAATWIVFASDAFGQIRIPSTINRALTIPGTGGQSYLGGYNPGGYNPGGYNPGSGYYPGSGYNPGGYYGSGYSSPYYRGGYYSNPSYYSSPSYYVDPAPSTIIQQSYYSAPAAQTALMTIIVPNSNAELWFNGVATSQRGMTRTFTTPAMLQSGSYSIRARWTQNGQIVDQTRRVDVQPGQSLTVDFRSGAPEYVPPARLPSY